MATQVFLDTFTEGGVGDVELSLHTPDVGTGWTNVVSTGGQLLEIEGPDDWVKATASGNSNSIVYTATPSPALGSADYDVKCTVTTAQTANDDPFFLVARYADTSNYYSAGNDGNRWVLAKRVANTVTVLDEAAGSITNGDTVTFQLRGSTLTVLQNSTEVLAASDSALTATGAPGMGMGNAWDVATDDISTVWKIDNFEVTDQTATGVTRDPGTGAAVLTGLAGFLAFGMLMSVGAAAFTGHIPTVLDETPGASPTLEPAQDDLVLTGAAAVLGYSILMPDEL